MAQKMLAHAEPIVTKLHGKDSKTTKIWIRIANRPLSIQKTSLARTRTTIFLERK
jgi:hypothetical protein